MKTCSRQVNASTPFNTDSVAQEETPNRDSARNCDVTSLGTSTDESYPSPPLHIQDPLQHPNALDPQGGYCYFQQQNYVPQSRGAVHQPQASGWIGNLVNFPSTLLSSRSHHSSQHIPAQHNEYVSMGEYQRLNERASHYRSKYHDEQAKVAGFARQLEDRRKDIENLNKLVSDLQLQNEEFRAQIFAMGTGGGPLNDEEFYSTNWEELKCLVEKQIVKLSKAQVKQTLPEAEQTKILHRLSKLGPRGVKCADFLRSDGHSLQKLYNENHWRHSLLRHIVALFLLDRVFEPFAFGISQELSDGLKFVEKDAKVRGCALHRSTTNCIERKFFNVLMIHQANGRGAALFSAENLESSRADVIDQLTHILCPMLRQSPADAVAEAVGKIIDKAIPLKKAMTEEQAIYHCFWPEYKDEFKEDLMEVADEEPSDRVLFCIFPGLTREFKKHTKISKFLVVKAWAVLESALDP